MTTRTWSALFLGLALTASAAAAQVTLPLTDYDKLRGRASPPPEETAVPPAPFALESAELEVAVGPASARLTSTLTLTLNAPGWQSVALGEIGSLVASDLGGLEGRVVAADSREGGKSGPSLSVRGSGRHVIRLESVLPVARDETSTRPTWRLQLLPPQAAVVRGTVRAADGAAAIAEVEEIALSQGISRREATGLFRFVASPREPLAFALYGRQTLPERARLPLRFEATSASAVTLSRTRLAVETFLELRVAQGRLAEAAVPLPAGFEVVRVGGPIAGWDVKNGRLTVVPLAPVESTFSFGVELSAPPQAAFAPPLLKPEGADRVSYLALARLDGDGILRLTDPGATRAPSEAELASLPRALRQTAARPAAVTDPARPPRFEALWAERTEVLAAQVDRLRVEAAVGEAGQASYRMWLVLRNRGAQQLTVTLPPGFELAAASRDGKPIVPGTPATAGTTGGEGLAIPLLSREAPQVLYLSGLLPLALPEQGDFAIPLPALSAPAARVEVKALLPGDRHYELADPTRAAEVAPPPRPNAAAPLSAAVANVARQVALPASLPVGEPLEPLDAASGFVTLSAAWSALSASPSPLALRIRPLKEKSPWF